MWIMTPFGFFSIVCARAANGRPDHTLRMVRARNLAHLQALAAQWPALPEIVQTEDTDYPYRIIAGWKLVAEITFALVADMDYCNFKNEAKQQYPDEHAYHSFLGSVWGLGLHLTPPGVRSLYTGNSKPGGFFQEGHHVDNSDQGFPAHVELPGFNCAGKVRPMVYRAKRKTSKQK